MIDPKDDRNLGEKQVKLKKLFVVVVVVVVVGVISVVVLVVVVVVEDWANTKARGTNNTVFGEER